jgi:hypothetical protein
MLCVELGLIERDSGQLTKLGRDALREGHFGRIVAKQARKALEDKGFDFETLHSVRRRTVDSLWLPTARVLYETGAPTMTLPDFRRLLNLMVECGHLKAVQSRVYITSGS